MKMKNIEITIRGRSPLLQHAFDGSSDDDGENGTKSNNKDYGTPRQQAERHVYRDGKTFYMPTTYVMRMIREAGGNYKQKSSRKSVKYLVPAAVFPEQATTTLVHPDTGKPLTDYEVDSRPVTIPSTKGRIMRHRPRFDIWAASFSLVVDENVLDEKMIQTLLVEGGRAIGIGDFRPACGGPFGRFDVVFWRASVLEQDDPYAAIAAE